MQRRKAATLRRKLTVCSAIISLLRMLILLVESNNSNNNNNNKNGDYDNERGKKIPYFRYYEEIFLVRYWTDLKLFVSLFCSISPFCFPFFFLCSLVVVSWIVCARTYWIRCIERKQELNIGPKCAVRQIDFFVRLHMAVPKFRSLCVFVLSFFISGARKSPELKQYCSFAERSQVWYVSESHIDDEDPKMIY